MMATSHALVAGVIAASVPNPLLSGPLIVTSHFLMDMIPHWDFGTDWEKRSKAKTGMLALGETLVSFILMLVLFGQVLSLPMLLYAYFLTQIPDWIQAPWYILYAKQGTKPSQGKHSFLWHIFYQIDKFEDYFHTRATFPFGVITQVITILFFFLLLKK